jgi:predicted AAA+ superfamily ATPase
VLLDEWQVVPEVLGAVKRAVDDDPRPGRFLVTGSVRSDLEDQTWPGTGRLVRLPLFGMTVGEHQGAALGPFLDAIAREDFGADPNDAPDLRGYIELALRGGFPDQALDRSLAARERWLESYVEQMITRDAELVDGGRDPVRLRRFFEAYALSSAGVPDDRTLYEAAAIDRKTAIAYERLLANLMVVEATPAWTSNRIKRLALSPKRYVTDSALIAGALRLDERGVIRDGDMLGRLLETFVAAQLRAESTVTASRPRMYHLRERQGRHEIDLVAEQAGGRVVAIEIKASAAPTTDDARHLSWLRERLGDRFAAGVVFHTGPRVFRLGERILAVPICALWDRG